MGGASPAGDRANPGHPWQIQRDVRGEHGLYSPGVMLGWAWGDAGLGLRRWGMCVAAVMSVTCSAALRGQ